MERIALHVWEFRRLGPDGTAAEAWSAVELPHSPFVADLDGREHWFGIAEYRRVIERPAVEEGGLCTLNVGAAMHHAQVLVDGREIARHEGGYLPFEFELTPFLRESTAHELLIRVDSREDPDIPPGKPFDELDFCWYGGLYRDAFLCVYPAVHITPAIAANEVAGGGVFVRTVEAGRSIARLNVRTHLRNGGPEIVGLRVEAQIETAKGDEVATAAVSLGPFTTGTTRHVELDVQIRNPRLWSPEDPSLHKVRVVVRSSDGRVVDERSESIGIRRISFSRRGGFEINGRRLRLRGTNRHQEFPRVGYAAPRAAQFRDARRIKEAGFDYVRLSHYPQSPDFLDACDELGIVVTNCIPGWQFMGGERFRAACFASARQLIRRDRNHPCVVLWELSLNETAMDDTFMATLHAIGHEEYPGDQMFTCGWLDRYDVFLHSRQHGMLHTWENGDKALVVAEYGDWEFYAENDGFNQKTGSGLRPRWSNARKLRADGEAGLRQQVGNHIVALNDTLASPAVLDGQWSMFDYARGYDPVRAACGVMDVFRLPKFSYHFYRSQRSPNSPGAGWNGGPMVFIASHWTSQSDLNVPVFSNCDEVELRLDGRQIERIARRPSSATPHLPHPPFMFHVAEFRTGTLEATGWLAGKACCVHRVATPGDVAELALVFDGDGDLAPSSEPDLLLVHAELRDAAGSLCVNETSEVEFAVTGDARVVGPARANAEAGIASVVVAVPRGAEIFSVNVRSIPMPRLSDRRMASRRDDHVEMKTEDQLRA
jgi:beta-galactosidase